MQPYISCNSTRFFEHASKFLTTITVKTGATKAQIRPLSFESQQLKKTKQNKANVHVSDI